MVQYRAAVEVVFEVENEFNPDLLLRLRERLVDAAFTEFGLGENIFINALHPLSIEGWSA